MQSNRVGRSCIHTATHFYSPSLSLSLSLLFLFLLKNSNSAQCRFVSGQLVKWRAINTRGLLNLKQSGDFAVEFYDDFLPSLYLHTNRQIYRVLQTRLEGSHASRRHLLTCGLPIPTQGIHSRKRNWQSIDLFRTQFPVQPRSFYNNIFILNFVTYFSYMIIKFYS